VDVEDELPRLLKALALSQRFHLYVTRCASPRAADRLIEALATELPTLRGAPVRLVRLEPYAAKTTDAPLTRELLEDVLVPLLDAPSERRQHGTIHIVDASRASSSDDDTWAQFFALWNEKRNLLQRLGGEVIVVLPRALALVFATDAPDVWSIRSGEYEILERTEVGSTRGLELSSEIRERLPTWRLLPPLSLFGGDIVTQDWLNGVLGPAMHALPLPPPLASGKDNDPQLEITRRLRAAERALGMGRFADGVAQLDPLVGLSRRPEENARTRIARAIALAALDRPESAWADALATVASIANRYDPTYQSMYSGAAYVAWCGGELALAESFDDLLRDGGFPSSRGAQLLRTMERGLMREAAELVAQIAPSTRARDVAGRRGQAATHIAPRLIAADYKFLFHRIGEARRDVEDVMGSTSAVADAQRAATLNLFLAVAEEDLARAQRLLPGVNAQMSSQTSTIQDRHRESFALYVQGILAMTAGNRVGALAVFELALAAMERWSQIGFERRSIRRAQAAAQLAAAWVEPDLQRAKQRAASARVLADGLLQPTEQDFIARVLAVEARWASAYYASNETAAHEAIDLAQPLRTAGVDSWTALADRRLDDLAPIR
jgi:hypothetical protein